MADRLRAAIAGLHRAPEAEVVRRLRSRQPDPSIAKRITEASLRLAERVRAAPAAPLSAESFLRQYGLSTPEGVALMCVAEALLRIPDAETADALLRDKLASGNWNNASAADWALMLTGALVRWHDEPSTLKNLISRLGEPIVRTAVKQAMRILAGQFVVGETIEQATARAAERPRYRFSYDMLGEAARTADDAARYLKLYSHAIEVARSPDSVSVKLSALHPRFEEAKRARILQELIPKVRQLAELAAQRKVGMTIDAEESERLELTLEVLESVPSAGIAVQAYQKRALAVCEWLVELGRSSKRRIPVRLVKGAYWDGEVKRAQQLGMPDYPLFTRKAATDVSYVACATTLLSAPDAIAPAFATHNCRTLATILELAQGREFEFQKLFGMGDALYAIALADHPQVQCRVYAPVGSFTDLLPYLVRRLLENGANTSFVHQIADPRVPLAALVADPMSEPLEPDPRIPLPRDLYPDRRNSLGMDLSLRRNLDGLKAHVAADGALPPVEPTSPEELDFSLARATEAFESWSCTPASERAAILDRAAGLLEERMVELVSLIVREGWRTFADAVAEVREAADFCRYYALQARLHFSSPRQLSGPAGERNELSLNGRGVFACISPWNFPLAIFTGQVAAALAAGNAVIAKPAEQTPRTGMRALEILYEAGVPADVACCAIGDGSLGARLVGDPRIAGVAFTGSLETAHLINKTLSERKGPIVPFIAETGGVNAMIVDSSALPEQVVDDTVASAFQSAGQRCSAQRILFVEAGAAPRTLELLRGALAELKVGDPGEPDTDVGPVIDAEAHAALRRHIDQLRKSAKVIGEAHAPAAGNYIAPIAFELELEELPKTEVFGPVLHVCVYQHGELDPVLAWLRDTGYGLTLGIHSRIQSFVDQVVAAARVGNIYVNRNMIGAVVGVQPFGGEGLSGTGPKAGGPHYLPRFAIERTLTVNTAAIGGVTELLSRPERPMP
jgi:RHH-type transcriptional regulator, proline utilization regulon repressor / proline dehydrogenase / delta 1-pyrroline-5-carboxylate dehydrogenase